MSNHYLLSTDQYQVPRARRETGLELRAGGGELRPNSRSQSALIGREPVPDWLPSLMTPAASLELNLKRELVEHWRSVRGAFTPETIVPQTLSQPKKGSGEPAKDRVEDHKQMEWLSSLKGWCVVGQHPAGEAPSAFHDIICTRPTAPDQSDVSERDEDPEICLQETAEDPEEPLMVLPAAVGGATASAAVLDSELSPVAWKTAKM
ncbi:unnamed protein product [Pleuronectes platessa]|uniref:Uncharacterized protein n=1 Tax=Pleuronectes platessa TaxID=8262 RepID=A0A9N7VBS8_PLEPL|nr:unnamed protein product [Pleuronectes platessa]